MKMHIDPEGIEFPLFKIALVEPEIPNNTGNIGRICVGLHSRLHIVGKPAFEISDTKVKRAGLDYWKDLDLVQHEDVENFTAKMPDPERIFYLSTKADKTIYDVSFQVGDTFVFGKETRGLDEELLAQNASQVLGLPMIGPIRSQNLANSVSVVMYEGLRQVLWTRR